MTNSTSGPPGNMRPAATAREKEKLFEPSGNLRGPRGLRLYGKYRGRVVSNIDPDITQPPGRLLVYVEQLPSAFQAWALPCVPYAGLNVGFWALPPTGASVWVEFEGGDPTRPVWSGCYWQVTDWILPRTVNPVDPSQAKIFKTGSMTLTVNDTPGVGGVSLDVNPPAVAVPVSINIDSLGMKISCAICTVTISPTQGVSISVAATQVGVTPQSHDITAVSISEKATNISVQGVVSVEGNTTIKGNTTNQGPFAVQGTSQLTGQVTIQGASALTGDLSVTGNSTLTGNVSVSGQTTFGGAISAAGNLTSAGAINVAGTVNVAGAVSSPAFNGVLNGTVVPPPV